MKIFYVILKQVISLEGINTALNKVCRVENCFELSFAGFEDVKASFCVIAVYAFFVFMTADKSL